MKNTRPEIIVAVLIGFICCCSTAMAQKQLASPRDSVHAVFGNAVADINYGSPSVKGRKIWGALVPWNEVWRAGANEATRFSCTGNLLVEGKELKAGTFALFAIPGEDHWIIIFNKDAYQWGAFEYNERDDVLRIPVTAVRAGEMQEKLQYRFTADGFMLVWENIVVPVKLKATEN